jgi:hypothetical protein
MSVARIGDVNLALSGIKKRVWDFHDCHSARSELRVHEVLYLLDGFVLGKLIRVGNRNFFRDVVVYLLFDDAMKGFHLL